MANCGNFLETAATKCGVDVGFGKMILVFPDKTAVTEGDLTAEGINAMVVSCAINGIIKGWHMVAGAPVAEITVERTGTGEMKQIRPEIIADTMTFESNIGTRAVLSDLVKAGTLDCILIDDLGSAFGEASENANELLTMKINFSGKATSSLQSDQTNEKTVAVTARYLVKNLDLIAAEIEVEDILGKEQLYAGISEVVSFTNTSIVLDMIVKSKDTGAFFDGAILATDIEITGTGIASKTAAYVPETGVLTLTIAGTGFVAGDLYAKISMSGDEFYMKSNKYTVSLGE
jgi:hypothetical protein